MTDRFDRSYRDRMTESERRLDDEAVGLRDALEIRYRAIADLHAALKLAMPEFCRARCAEDHHVPDCLEMGRLILKMDRFFKHNTLA